ncbi:MAG: T9SS type A sorting domain-containing protein [Bacteroidetes bacterium]|nr:T9SS type A sorting domain-containing protein [Bacteroidota bacterium]
MKTILLAAAILVTVLTGSYAQQFRTCDTDEMMRKAKLEDPSYAVRLAELQQFTESYVQQAGNQKTSGTIIYTIPVVFHVIHNYGGENISKAQILDAVDILNKSFQKFYADSVDVALAFQPIIADVQVQFRLAQLDPNGNCTDGITRTVSSLTYAGDDQVKQLINWPQNKYFNIWVVQTIASGAAGYAYFPGITPAYKDGVVIRGDYVGSIGTSNGSNYSARSLTHEVGHYFNLAHTWGGTNNPGLPQNCSDDDFVQDTPNTIGVNNFSCDTTQITCGTLDNVQNYMDYASCHLMFTEGQKARMHAALNSSASSRNNLHDINNLIATGTNDGFVPSPCAPLADFNGDIKYICAGTSITYNDLSWTADPTSWNWDVPGGTPSTSADQNPVIQYNTPGVYDVTLTASNAGGSNSTTRTGIVVVSPATGANAVPFVEDFENTGPIPSSYDWIVENEAGNAWQLSTVAAFSGSNSMRLLNHSGNANGTTDVFVTPGYDLTNIVSASMTFQLAFAARSNSSTDQLKVFASNNCGQQWNIRYTKTGLTLSTAGILSASFTPTSAQWRQENVNISGVAYNNRPSVRFKFEYSQNTGNNIYIDDINITGTSTVGIQDVEFLATLSVYPNPTNGLSNISFSLSEPQTMKIEITDVAGRIVEVVENNKLQEGNYNYSFGKNLSEGVYFVRFQSNDNDLTRKVIVTK